MGRKLVSVCRYVPQVMTTQFSIQASFILLPLLAVLIICCVIELRTGRIPNALTLSGMFYMMAVQYYVGDLPWLNYFLAAAFMSVLLITVGWHLPTLLHREEWIGAGAVKLVAVVGLALGVSLSVKVFCIFVITAALVLATAIWKLGRSQVPSSPLLLLSVISALFWEGYFA